MNNQKLNQSEIDTVCEAYSEHYAIYNRGALINLLCELYPTRQCDVTEACATIRENLRVTYNIFA